MDSIPITNYLIIDKHPSGFQIEIKLYLPVGYTGLNFEIW